jgi:hypothetical protein
MKLELKHLAPYLPHELKCQYTGIVDVNKYNSTKIDPSDINQDRGYGLKIGFLKEIHVFKKYWTARCGIYSRGLKTFTNGYDLKPILRPLSDLTKEIEVDGNKFIPIIELACLNGAFGNDKDRLYVEEKYFRSENEIVYFVNYHTGGDEDDYILSISYGSIWCTGYQIVQKLFEWHFDVFGLIDQGLAIDINTLTK